MKSKGKAVEENESTSVQSQQGAKKVVNEKSPTKYVGTFEKDSSTTKCV